MLCLYGGNHPQAGGISRVGASYLKLGDILFRFSGFREKF